MKILKEHLKSGKYKKVYLFFGEESYILKVYEKKMIEKVIPKGMEMMNLDILEGKSVTSSQIIDVANTAPFMSDKRLVIVKDSGFLKNGKKDESEKISNYLNKIPESTIIIFIETEVDKRSKLYKKIVEKGYVCEFSRLTEKEMVDWIIRLFKGGGIEVSKNIAIYILRAVDSDMENIENEVKKLIAYSRGEKEITFKDVDEVCTKSVESKIFDLVEAIGNKNCKVALNIFNNLIMMKQSPIMVLSMCARHFRMLLQCFELKERGIPESEVAKEMGQRSFIVNKLISQCKNFTKDKLKSAHKECLDTDTAIKTGKMSDKLAVEVLIIKYSTVNYI